MSQPSDSTIQYYDDHAEDYARSTAVVDMSSLYAPFLAMIPNGGRILDAGSGSGRDTKAFLDMGYNVTATDASNRMAALASRLSGVPVRVMRFQEMSYEREFDGVWACASLLHVPRSELADVIVRLGNSLRPSGICYASFKHGDGERIEVGRLFNDMTENEIERLFFGCPVFSIATQWTTSDARPGRTTERWVNVLLRKIK